MMLVNSRSLAAAAEEVRARNAGPQYVPAAGVYVTAEQLDTAARLLREAEPSICNGRKSERPGFIHEGSQVALDSLVLDIGILSTERYVIARDGSLRESARAAA